MGYGFIKQEVSRVKEQYGTSDPYEISELLGIVIVFHVLGSEVNAFYYSQGKTSMIVINCELCEASRRAVLAHELGHLFLHPKVNSLFGVYSTFALDCKNEYEADLFSCELLISDEDLQLHDSVLGLSSILNVPTWVVERKLRGVNTRGLS